MEVHYPEGDAVLVYDGDRTTPERVGQALHDIFPDMEFFIDTDRPFQ